MKKLYLLTLICIIAVTALCFGCDKLGPYPGDVITDGKLVRELPEGVTQFSTLADLKNAFSSQRNDDWRYGYYSMAKGLVDESDSVAMPNADGAVYAAAPEDHSQTNVQTQGVDEGDVVKTDGQYIYCLNSTGFNIARAQQGNLEKTFALTIDNYYPIEMYQDGDILVLIGGIYQDFDYRYIDGDFVYYSCIPYFRYSYRTDIRIYDISDKTAPAELRHVVLDGNYDTSRMTDGHLFYIVNYTLGWYYYNEEDFRPDYSDSAKENGAEVKLPLEDIYKIGNDDTRAFTIVGKMDLSNGAVTQNKINGYIGASGELYASENYLYLAGTEYEYSRVKNEDKKLVTSTETSRTTITKIAMSDLSVVARSSVMGTLNDRFSMDEYQGNLRVATTTNQWIYNYFYGNNEDDYLYYDGYDNKRVNRVYVLDGSLKQIGLIDGIAEGESIYSCRFNGAKGSLVTFENIDPYYNLDLSDPTHPTISKGLKEDGVSYYIHYLGDSGYTIGVGVNTYRNKYGNAVSDGIKISLYDNNSGEAVNVVTYIYGDYDGTSLIDSENTKVYVLGGYGYTPLTYESKALLYDERIGLFAFPVSYSDQTQGFTRQGLAVFRFDVENGTLEYRGLLSNVNQSYDYYYYYYLDTISRGVRIGDYIYTISDSRIVSYDLETLSEYKSIEFISSETYADIAD